MAQPECWVNVAETSTGADDDSFSGRSGCCRLPPQAMYLCHAPAPPDAPPLSAYGVAAGIEPKKNYQPTNQARVILIFSVSYNFVADGLVHGSLEALGNPDAARRGVAESRRRGRGNELTEGWVCVWIPRL